MDLEITSDRVGDVVVLTLVGTIAIGEPCRELRKVVREVEARWQLPNVVLDLSGVHSIDSAGLGELKIIRLIIKREDGKMFLLNTGHLEAGIQLKLGQEFDTFNNRSEALAAFGRQQ